MSPKSFVEFVKNNLAREDYEYFFVAIGDLTFIPPVDEYPLGRDHIYIIDNKTHFGENKITNLIAKRYPFSKEGFESFKEEALLELL